MNPLRLDTSLELLLERMAAVPGPAVIATIVATAGSTYRKAGARMLIEPDGRFTGLLSGGCLEHDLREHADQVLSTEICRSVAYDMRGHDDLLFGIGAGCEGAMRILLEPGHQSGSAASALHTAGQHARDGQPAVLAIVHRGSPAALGTRVWPASPQCPMVQPLALACTAAIQGAAGQSLCWQESGEAHEAWIQVIAPVPNVLVCGAGADAEPLVAGLRALRFEVTVVDHRPAYADPMRFPGAHVVLMDGAMLGEHVDLGRHFAAVVMSHHLLSDAAYLRGLATSAIPYIGLLGPLPRRERLLADIGECAALLHGRLRGPVGFDIGAVTPEGIALAITAELHAFASGRVVEATHWSSL